MSAYFAESLRFRAIFLGLFKTRKTTRRGRFLGGLRSLRTEFFRAFCRCIFDTRGGCEVVVRKCGVQTKDEALRESPSGNTSTCFDGRLFSKATKRRITHQTGDLLAESVKQVGRKSCEVRRGRFFFETAPDSGRKVKQQLGARERRAANAPVRHGDQ
jgi:hypothetical protein